VSKLRYGRYSAHSLSSSFAGRSPEPLKLSLVGQNLFQDGHAESNDAAYPREILAPEGAALMCKVSGRP
jgi:hypothetical protein